MPTLALITLAAHGAALLRVLTYRRVGARHRPGIAWLAWTLAVALGGSIIDRLLQNRPADWFDAATAVLLAAFTWAVRGNVARLLGAGAHTR